MAVRWSMVLLFGSIILGGLVVWMGRVENPETLGIPAQDFSLVDLDGNLHTLSEYEGQVVIVNFWATWCGPCRAEMPALQAIYDEYQDDGLVLLAVNQDESPATINAFITEHDLTFPILLDDILQISRLYEIEAYPSTFFIDRRGRIRNSEFGGPMSKSFIESQILNLLDN